MRSRKYPEGFPLELAKDKSIPSDCLAKVANDNILAERTDEAVRIMKSLGKAFVVEQPWPWKDEAPDVDELEVEQRCRIPFGKRKW